MPAEADEIRAAGGWEGALVLWLREGAAGGSGRRRQDVRGLRQEAATHWAADAWVARAVVWRVQEVRGLPAEDVKLWAAVGQEAALVRSLREAARRGGERG